jgi:hypothetical protein
MTIPRPQIETLKFLASFLFKFPGADCLDRVQSLSTIIFHYTTLPPPSPNTKEITNHITHKMKSLNAAHCLKFQLISHLPIVTPSPETVFSNQLLLKTTFSIDGSQSCRSRHPSPPPFSIRHLAGK